MKAAAGGWLTVQIAPWLGARAKAIFPSIRLAQQAVGELLADVATVVTQDLGDPLNPPPYRSMHPRNKTVVGDRLAAAALALGMIDASQHGDDRAVAAEWGGPRFSYLKRTTETAFEVGLTAASGLHLGGSDKCQDAATDDSGRVRPSDQRCCAAADTFQLWPTLAASEGKNLSAASNVQCATAGGDGGRASLRCTSGRPIPDGAVWTFAFHNFPPCLLKNEQLQVASPMRAIVPTKVGATHGAAGASGWLP